MQKLTVYNLATLAATGPAQRIGKTSARKLQRYTDRIFTSLFSNFLPPYIIPIDEPSKFEASEVTLEVAKGRWFYLDLLRHRETRELAKDI